MNDAKQKDDTPKKHRQSPWGTGAMDWKDETKGEGLKQAFKAFSMLASSSASRPRCIRCTGS